STTFSPMAAPYSIFTMVYGYGIGPGAHELHVDSPVGAFCRYLWLVIPAGLVAAAGLLLGFRWLWVSGEAGRLVVSVVAVPFAAVVLLALLNVKPFNVRYVAVTLPVVVVTLSVGMASLPVRRGAWLLAAVVLFSLVSLQNYYFVPEYAREDVRGVARYVAENERPGDIVLVPVVRDVFTFYFEGQADHFVLYRGQAKSADAVRRVVDQRTEGLKRLWFVDSRLWHVDSARWTPSVLEERYERLDTRRFSGATVSLYALDGNPAAER
ncbi:MAG: hypothetical protein KAW67_02165, partial [Candidatus Eisenbacteria sp.]|nr:hypothetical protein [Candidatus Eisenbacteria bacterium]